MRDVWTSAETERSRLVTRQASTAIWRVNLDGKGGVAV